MKVEVKPLNGWEEALDAARETVWAEPLGKEPSDAFKKRMIASEHSPLREVRFSVRMTRIRYWVMGHLVRHHVGAEKYVSSSREDRKPGSAGTDRDLLPQGAPVNLRMTMNAQSLIDTSRRRLCECAHPRTREAWYKVRAGVARHDKLLAQAMVPECVRRGFCPEGSPHFCKLKWERWREAYLSTMKEWACAR